VLVKRILKNSLKMLLLSLDGIQAVRVIPVLLYHSVDDSERIDSVSLDAFTEQMEYLYRNEYRVVSLDEVIDLSESGGNNGRRRAVAITFDDGYESVYRHALPILQKYGFTASVFIPTKYVDKASEWIEPSVPLLTWNEIISMQEMGFLFGSHGHSHRDLTDLTEEQAKEELEISKRILEDKLGIPVKCISYPFSKSNRIIEDITLGCGYETLFSAFGAERKGMPDEPCLFLRRSVMRDDRLLSFRCSLSNTYSYYSGIKRLLGMVGH
jgi:peptidoglycan/xylan/chitin deacetylase (PgdA/CDA1 family)